MGPIYDIGSLASVVAHLLVAHSTGVLYNVIEPEPIFRGRFLLVVSFGVSEIEFFFLFLGLNVVFGDLFGLEFGQVDVLFPVSEVSHLPLAFFFVPFRVVDDHVDLVDGHQHVEDG